MFPTRASTSFRPWRHAPVWRDAVTEAVADVEAEAANLRGGPVAAWRAVLAGVALFATLLTLTSINPVWAALAGWIVLGQALAPAEWTGMGLIVASNAVVSARGRRAPAVAAPEGVAVR